MEKQYYKKTIRKIIKICRLNILDKYIIKKFIGTFAIAILLIVIIAVIFDFSEKVDDFLENNAPFKAIIFNYYLNFMPYFAVLFSPLFTFIAVIYFTSKMAYNTEIIAILSSGISFNRILRPFFYSAAIIAIFSFALNNYILPQSTKKKLAFEDVYYHAKPATFKKRNFHRQLEPGVNIYIENYVTANDYGQRFSIEKFENGKLVSKLLSERIIWDSIAKKWTIYDYYIREYKGDKQIIRSGQRMDTVLNMKPSEFKIREETIEGMNLTELNNYIKEQKKQGASSTERLLVEKNKRFSMPFSTFILTVIGVSVSGRKLRGGIGIHIGIGLLLSFSYLLFVQFSTQFAISGALSPFLAVWSPNFLYAIIAFFIYRMLPK